MAKQVSAPVQTEQQTPPETDKPEDTTLTKVMRGFRESREYAREGFWDTWTDAWKLYNNQRVSIGYDGFSDTFIPETYTEVQQMKAHLINGNLTVEFLPTHPDQSGKSDVLQDLSNYAWYKDYMDQKIDQAVTEELVTGNCYIWSSPDKDGLPSQVVKSAKDCFFDPQATNYEDLCEYGFAGYRYLTTVDDLREYTVTNSQYNEDDPKSTPKISRFKNLDKVGEFIQDEGDPTAKQEREDMLGDSVLDSARGVVECIVYYDKHKMVTVANRSVVIEEVDTPFQRPEKVVQSVDDQGQAVSFVMPEIAAFIPVAPFRNIVDLNLWYARGDVEIIADSQERLNDVQAQKTDNLTYQLNRMWALDPNFAQKLDEIQSVPGAVFTIPPGALEQIPTQPIGPDADNEISRIKSEMQAASGINEAFQSTTQTTGRQSAYQINQNLVALGARFQVKIKSLENEGMRILAQNMWKIMQIFIDKEIPVRVTGPNNEINWDVYNPGLYLGDWDVQVKLGATADTIKETQRQQMMQFYLLASKQSFVDPQKLFVQTTPQIFPEINQRIATGLLLPPQPPQTPPTAAAALASSIQFESLYPDEQAEVLTDLGIEPSPFRQDQTGINPSNPDPAKVAANMAALHGQGTPGAPQQANEQAGMQIAGDAPVGAPTSGVANVPDMVQG